LRPICDPEGNMNKVKLTKRIVENVKADGRRITLNDSEIKGFQCRISPAGIRTYYLYYRTLDGQERRPKIGGHGAVTTEQARMIAKKWLAQVADGQDPSLARQGKRHGETVKDFAKRYIEQYAKVKKKASSAAMDQLNIDSHIIPTLGTLKLASVTRRDIVRLHHSMRSTPYAANRVLALLSKMFNVAEQWEERPPRTNPCYMVEKYKEKKRERFLSMQELAHLSDTLREVEFEAVDLPGVVPAIRLLIFTGCRRGEILTLKWDYVDMENHCLNLPDSKTGEKRVYLTAPALEVLANVKKVKNNPYVITGKNKGVALNNIDKPWLRIKERTTIKIWQQDPAVGCIIDDLKGDDNNQPNLTDIQEASQAASISLQGGIMDVRLHDLRHTFASVAVGGGQTLPMIGKLLGHTQAQTTARYAHLADDPVREAAEAVGRTLSAAMAGTGNSNVVKFPRG